MREQRETSGSVSYLPALASCALSSKIPQLYPSFPSVLTPPAAWRSPLPGKSLLNFWDLAQVAGISAIFLIPTVALAYFVLFPPGSPLRIPMRHTPYFVAGFYLHACYTLSISNVNHLTNTERIPRTQHCDGRGGTWQVQWLPFQSRVQSGDICQRNNWRIN